MVLVRRGGGARPGDARRGGVHPFAPAEEVMRQVIGLTVVLALSLVGSYVTWTDDGEVIDDEAVVVYQGLPEGPDGPGVGQRGVDHDPVPQVGRGRRLPVESSPRSGPRSASPRTRSPTPREGSEDGEGEDGEDAEGEDAPEGADPHDESPRGRGRPRGGRSRGGGRGRGRLRDRDQGVPASGATPRPTSCGRTSLPSRRCGS